MRFVASETLLVNHVTFVTNKEEDEDVADVGVDEVRFQVSSVAVVVVVSATVETTVSPFYVLDFEGTRVAKMVFVVPVIVDMPTANCSSIVASCSLVNQV